MADNGAWPPQAPATSRPLPLVIAISLGAVLLAALVVVAVEWWPPSIGRHDRSGAESPVTGPPDRSVTASPLIGAATASVVRITATAPSCQRRIKGSGFVYATDRVMTAAHVVAGAKSPPTVYDRRGRSFKATVVAFDSARDLAALRVPGLNTPALSFRENAHVGDAGVIMGFSRDHGFTEAPARIRWARLARGPDIHQQGIIERHVLGLYGGIDQGMSGAPLVTTDGKVSGMAFGADLDDPQGSFALAVQDLNSQVHAGTTAVSTGSCSS